MTKTLTELAKSNWETRKLCLKAFESEPKKQDAHSPEEEGSETEEETCLGKNHSLEKPEEGK